MYALIEATCDTPPTLLGHWLDGSVAARFGRRLMHDHERTWTQAGPP